jgi:hypothetical protein
MFGDKINLLKVEVSILKNKDIEVQEEIVLRFSDKIIKTNPSKNISIYPKVDVSFKWEDSGRKLKIIPREDWSLGENYTIKIEGLRSIFLAKSYNEIAFKTIEYPSVNKFYPENNSRGIMIDIESPGIMKFDKSLKNFNLKVNVVPSEKLSYNINQTKNEVDFVFEDGYKKGEEYEIYLYIKHKDESRDKYKKIYETSFITEAPPAEEWSSNFQARLAEAKLYTNPLVKDGKYIDINLDAQIMTIFENAKLINSFLVSSGKRGMDTPKGTFRIVNKHPRPWSDKYGLYMPYWMAMFLLENLEFTNSQSGQADIRKVRIIWEPQFRMAV